MSSTPPPEEALSLWRAPLVSVKKIVAQETPAQLRADLNRVLDQAGHKIDSPELTTKLTGVASGMSLLSAIIHQFCHGRIEEQSALMLVSTVLSAGANPNLAVNQFTPADTFVDGLYRGSISASEALRMANVLVRAGMDANHTGFCDMASMHVKLATLDGHDALLRTLFDGPKAIELERATSAVSRRKHRRTL